MNDFIISGPFPSRKAFQVLRDRLIAHLIETGAAVGDPFASDARLMEVSGLSRTTVRKAVDDLCSAGWVERRAGVGSFVGPRVALPQPPPVNSRKAVQRRETVRVAVLLHLLGEGGVDYFTRGVLQGLDSAALEEGLGVELLGDGNMEIPALVKRLNRTHADMLVVLPCTTRHAMLAGVAEGMGLRCLLAGTHLYDSGLPTVGEDGEQGAVLATRHLIEHGHSRIGLWLSQAPAVWVHQRRNGYLKTLCDNKILPDERLVLWTPYSPIEDTACRSHLANVESFDAYMRAHKPTALVIGSSGQHTRTLGEWIRRARVRIPEDLSVIFLDQNFDDYSHYLHRRPTVVALPLVEMGRTLARLARSAYDAKARGEAPAATLSVLPCSLMEGDSVAAVPHGG